MNADRADHGFVEVDSSEDPRFWVNALDKLRREPFYIAYKKRISELLRPERGCLYLEVGAGTGDDALSVAEDSHATVIAVDISRTMMLEALRRGLQCPVVADAAFLPFPDNTFRGSWADRTFQHLPNPDRALSEIVRVTKLSGRIVTVDPDYGTQVLAFPDRDLARRVLRFRTDFGLLNGKLGHAMPALFADAGLIDLQTETMTLIVKDPTAVDNVMGLRTWASSACARGHLAKEDVRRWESLFDETVASGRFMYALTFFITVGRKSNL